MFEQPRHKLAHHTESWLLIPTMLLIGLFVGLRYEVGADWSTYVLHFLLISPIKLNEIPMMGDPGYVLFNWLASRLGGDVWLVNLACAALFSWGLLAFVKAQPRPWLALVIAVPYLIIVVAMGYTRQGVAIGLAMRGLVALGGERSNLRFVFWVLAAATFHKSAVVLIPISALAEDRGRLWTACWVGVATILGYFTLLGKSVDQLMYTYVQRGYDSDGAFIRVAMNALPALLLLLFWQKFNLRAEEKRLWFILALLALATVPALYLSPSTTAVDRVGLYLLPLQLVVLSRVPDTFAWSEGAARFLGLLVVIYSAVVQFAWLNYSSHADAWLPYQISPL
ncbi:EpsG family protein [Mesorhizobium sp. M0954]|uniref:EpsG family protein n=1 Tax=Mesorhizobium sp. M0954 TaxID=2957032 RepID=UPI00333CD533